MQTEQLVADAPSVLEKTAKRANNSQEFAQTKELVAPLTLKRTKMTDWCKICTKTILYQNMRYNSKKKQPLSIGQRLFLFNEINPQRDL